MKAAAACNFDIIVTPAHLSSICNFIELAITALSQNIIASVPTF